MSGSLSSAEGELNAIVKEYLELLKLDETLHIFEEECRKKGKPIQEHAGKGRKDEIIASVQKELFYHFDQGHRSNFFSAWETHVNSDVLDNDLAYHKLEFMLHVHFAVYPLRRTDHWVQEDVEESMFHFRHYLKTRGSYQSSCPDLLPFFGLPYVQCPASHPSFSEVFQELWVIELKKNLELFIWDHLKRRFKHDLTVPRLVELYSKNDYEFKEIQDEVRRMENKLDTSEKFYAVQTKKMDKLQEDCQQLMAVASLLVTALESAVKGNIVDLDHVLSLCAERFPDVYKLKTTEAENSESSKRPSNPIPNGFHILDDMNRNYRPPGQFAINFVKIKEDLCNAEERIQLLLLQALRWRLTKGGTWQQVQNTLSSFVDNDVLGLHSVSSKTFNFITVMQTHSVILRQVISRFLNSLACFSKGREYLSQCPQLLQALVNNLCAFQTKDSFIEDMTLGTLQKLSTRNVCQNFMIESSMMEWLTEILQQPHKLSDYGLEYSVALLMNLCLCPNGKERCESIKERLLLILCGLLQLDKKNIIGYVNGALYSILSLPNVKQYAIEQNLEDTLISVMQKSDPEVRKQLECIQELLHTDGDSEPCSSEEEEDTEDEEETNLEMELDMNDPVCVLPGETSGEVLLWKEYSLPITNIPAADDAENRKEQLLDVRKALHESSAQEHLKFNGRGLSSAVMSIRSNSVPPQGINHGDEMSLLQSPGKGHPASEPVTPKLDLEATQMVRKIVGQPSTTLVQAAAAPNPASVNIKGLNVNEYMVAFSSRPKIPRTPETSATAGSKRGKQQSSQSPRMDIDYQSSAWDPESVFDYNQMSPKIAASSPPSSPYIPVKSKELDAYTRS